MDCSKPDVSALHYFPEFAQRQYTLNTNSFPIFILVTPILGTIISWWDYCNNLLIASVLALFQSICNTSVRVMLFPSAQAHLRILYTDTHDGQQSNTYLAPTSSPASCPSITPIDESIAVTEAILCFQTDWAHSQPPCGLHPCVLCPQNSGLAPCLQSGLTCRVTLPQGSSPIICHNSNSSTTTPSNPEPCFLPFFSICHHLTC